MTPRWLVFQEGRRRRWGGDLRRAFIFSELARRTDATVIEGFHSNTVDRAVAAAAPRRFGLRFGPRPLVASSETLAEAALTVIESRTTAVALDVHDDPIAQLVTLGVAFSPQRMNELTRRMDTNLRAFAILVVPSASFADLARIAPDRRVVASNGTDTRHIRPEPFPDRPAIGFVSGAAPGRGIESLIAAAKLVRVDIPELALLLWLTATSNESARYLDSLRQMTINDRFIKIRAAPYEGLSAELALATVLAVPHPPGPYMDSAVPVKLFDSMAAGRPVVVTPRTEMAAIVHKHQVGVVAASDRIEDLAEALSAPFRDSALAVRLGASARRTAETLYDWRVVGAAVADEILART